MADEMIAMERRLAAVLDRTIRYDDPIMDADYLPIEDAPDALIEILCEYGADPVTAAGVAADLIRAFDAVQESLIDFIQKDARAGCDRPA